MERERRQAIVWISGLGESDVDQTAVDIAGRIAGELDRYAATPSAHFSVKTDARSERVGGTLDVEVATIQRDETPMVDLYRVPTEGPLMSDYMKRGALVRTLLVVVLTISYAIRAAPVFFSRGPRGKSRRARRQLLFARFALLLLLVYALVLVFGILTTVVPSFDRDLQRISQTAVLGMTLAGIWKSGFVRALSRAAVQYFCVMQYLNHGYRADVLRGHVLDVLEHIAEHRTIEYTDIDIVAYSFGTVVAIDTLLPAPSPPPDRVRRVRNLVTIACPFDLFRTYWPGYFDDRYALEGAPGQWVNVYSPVDVLASNFRNDDKQDPPEHGVGGRKDQPARRRPENLPYVIGNRSGLSAIETFLLMGLRMHAAYWGREAENESTVFGPVVQNVYARDVLMA